MADDHEERFRQHEQIMEGLARMLAAQHEFNREQREIMSSKPPSTSVSRRSSSAST